MNATPKQILDYYALLSEATQRFEMTLFCEQSDKMGKPTFALHAIAKQALGLSDNEVKRIDTRIENKLEKEQQ